MRWFTNAMALVFFVLCSSGTIGAAEPITLEVIRDVEMQKEKIFDNSLLWLAETARSSKDIVEFKDKELGVIVGNSTIKILIGGFVAKIPVEIKFKVRIEVKEKRYRLIFNNVIYSFDGYEVPFEEIKGKDQERGRQQIIPKFNSLADDLQQYLKGAENKKDW
jgi:hypothetical protein